MSDESVDNLPSLTPPSEPSWLSEDRQAFEVQQETEAEKQDATPRASMVGNREVSAADEPFYRDFFEHGGCDETATNACADWLDKNGPALVTVAEKHGLDQALQWGMDSLIMSGVDPGDAQRAAAWFAGAIRKQAGGNG